MKLTTQLCTVPRLRTNEWSYTYALLYNDSGGQRVRFTNPRLQQELRTAEYLFLVLACVCGNVLRYAQSVLSEMC